MSEIATGAIEAFSNDDNRFGLKVDGDWYNGFGDLPDKFQEKGVVVQIDYEVNKNNGKTYRNVDDPEEDIDLVENGNESGGGHDSASSASQSDAETQQSMGRQKPIEAVGRMFQGESPNTPQELNEVKVLLKELTNWSQNGDFAVDTQALDEGDTSKLEESINELSERLGEIEKHVKTVEDDMHAVTLDLEKRIGEFEERIDDLDDSEQDKIFEDEDDEEETDDE